MTSSSTGRLFHDSAPLWLKEAEVCRSEMKVAKRPKPVPRPSQERTVRSAKARPVRHRRGTCGGQLVRPTAQPAALAHAFTRFTPAGTGLIWCTVGLPLPRRCSPSPSRYKPPVESRSVCKIHCAGIELRTHGRHVVSSRRACRSDC